MSKTRKTLRIILVMIVSLWVRARNWHHLDSNLQVSTIDCIYAKLYLICLMWVYNSCKCF